MTSRLPPTAIRSIKQLLDTPLCNTPDQEIVYRDLKRMTYRELRERIGRLASGLSRLGPGLMKVSDRCYQMGRFFKSVSLTRLARIQHEVIGTL